MQNFCETLPTLLDAASTEELSEDSVQGLLLCSTSMSVHAILSIANFLANPLASLEKNYCL